MDIRVLQALTSLACMAALTTANASAIYDFSYLFEARRDMSYGDLEAMVLSGSFVGKQEGNLVWIEDDIQLYANGTRVLGDITFSASHFLIPELWFILGDAVASFDGSANNFMFYYNDRYGYERRIFQSIPQGYKGEMRWTTAGGFQRESYSDFLPSGSMNAQWSLAQRIDASEVPEPASLALFGLGAIAAWSAIRRSRAS